jgi:hypothetical protein
LAIRVVVYGLAGESRFINGVSDVVSEALVV